MIISPSILSCDFLNIESEIKQFDNVSDIWLHLDIMDGHFVPNLTFGKPVIQNLHKITKHKLDAHFMVTNPEFHAEECKDSGLHNFTFHWEACIHHDRLISRCKEIYPSVGISLNPSTNIEIIPQYIFEKIDLVLIMSVNPGFGGQSFISSSIDKVKYLANIKNNKNLKFQIQVDGGVNNQTVDQLRKAGANNLVAGSYIFNSNDYIGQINSLR